MSKSEDHKKYNREIFLTRFKDDTGEFEFLATNILTDRINFSSIYVYEGDQNNTEHVNECYLPKDQALALARWIIENVGDGDV